MGDQLAHGEQLIALSHAEQVAREVPTTLPAERRGVRGQPVQRLEQAVRLSGQGYAVRRGGTARWPPYGDRLHGHHATTASTRKVSTTAGAGGGVARSWLFFSSATAKPCLHQVCR